MKILRIYINSFNGLSKEAWMLAVVMLINRSGSMVLPFLGVYMTEHLHFSIKDSGIVLSFFGIGSVIGSWLGGFITDRFGEFRVQVLSLFLSAPLFALLPFFTTVQGLAAIILVQSIISESFRPANSVAITRYAKPENLTRAFSLNRMAINLGFSIGPALGGILAAISYNFLFAVNALGALAAGVVYFRFFRTRSRQFRKIEKERKKETDTITIIKEESAYRDLPFIVYSVFCGIFSVCFFQFFNTLPLFYKEVVGLDQQTIGYILGYSGFIIVVMEMLLVNMAEKYLSAAATLLIGTLATAIAYSVLVINHHLATLTLSITILSLAEILVLPFMAAITAVRSGKGNKGSYMGLNGMAIAVSFIITPYLGTRVASDLGFTTLWAGTGVILLAVAVAFYFCVKRILPADIATGH
ncbi:MFS transporter [Niabella ginsenosidivorans]|uniref:MFS transporter n=1 Tax=Niabella ginsenosidivorans TaxID=1176587 RepID=A0A1A9I274_9BACT|nr:MFS transporter [Niabella ginsenosidivorans]ANH80801.1 MFS transporter [Niabella ginsenosidivorans]